MTDALRPRPPVAEVTLGDWTFAVRDGWRPGRPAGPGKPAELRSPSDHGLLQTSSVEIFPAVTPEIIKTTARSTLDSAGVPADAPIGELVTKPTGEIFAGSKAVMGDGNRITVLVAGNGTSLLIQTYIHDGTEPQEESDADATMFSGRWERSPPKQGGVLGRLLGR